MGGGPTEILPPKKQAVVERLRRRIESYRKHQNECVPRFDHSFNGVVEQNVQDTLLLKQRFLENKAKRTVKKSEKKPIDNSVQNTSNSLPKYGTKRSASEDVEPNSSENSYISNKTASSSNTGVVVDGPPSKSSPASNASNNKENLTKFSVEIVQQLEFTTTTANSQISANVTVKAMNTCIKSDPASSPPTSPRQAHTPQQVIECKREPEMKFVDLEECAAALEKDAAVLHGNSSFPAFTDLIGDDTSDAFNDLISDISDFNTEFMRDFDFDNSDHKTTNISCNNNSSNNNNSSQTPQSAANQMPNSPPVVHDESMHQIKTESKDLSHLHPSCSQNRINFHPGLEMRKPELSPAAQTLKQMAEQHQVKVAALAVNYGSRLSNYGPVSTQNTANNSPYSQELKQEAYSNNGQNQNTQNNQQGSPGPQNQQSRSGSPGGHRYKTNFNNFTSRSGGTQRTPPQSSGGGSGVPSSLNASQTQQILAQGHQIQVSLAQNMSAELKSGAMTLGAQQGAFFSGSSNSDNFCSVSQSQTLNFTQHNLRGRTSSTPRHPHHNIRTHLPVVMEVINPNSHLGGRQEFSNKPHNVQYPLPRFAQPRMISLQPIMPPSGPLLRGPYINPVVGARGNLPSGQGKPLREMTQQNENISWKHMVIHPSRNTHFHPNQGVTFSSNDNQVSGGQPQHISLPQHPSLGLHQINPSMSVRINMTQNMSANSIFSTGGKPSSGSSQDPSSHITSSQDYHPPNSSYNSNPLIYSNSSYGHPLLQQHAQQTNSNNLPPPSDFNLDFLEQLPTDNTGHFTDQDLINSLESSGNFNFHDIL